jgi:ammonium transporter Rh
MMNTAISLFGSVMGTACHARILFGKLEMVTMLNATLAGAVMIGPSVDIIKNPGVTLLIGLFAGLTCSMGFEKLTPFLQKTIRLQDTCGIHNLHCLMGVIGAVISAIAIAGSGTRGFGNGYFPMVQNDGDEMSQAWSQIYGCIVTCLVAIIGGVTGGFITSRACF